MGRVTEGGKAGLLAGLIYAVLTAAVVVTLLILFQSSVVKVVGTGVAYNQILAADALVAVIFGIVAGILLGLVYGAVSDRIPGRRGVTKGLVFALILWAILHVLADYLGNLKYGVTFYLVDIGLGLGTSLVYGVLLGVFFERAMNRLASSGRKDALDESGSTQESRGARP